MTDVGALLIRLTTGFLMVVYGISQVVRPHTWYGYMPPLLQKLLPMSNKSFMREHGVGNLTLGVLLLLNIKPEWLYWIVLVWWLSILPFTFYEDWRSGLRDVVIIASIVGLIVYVAKQ